MLGESGAGKELAARTIHQLSARADKAFVARNAATFPEGLVDAELFGTAKNYPHSGSLERAGVVMASVRAAASCANGASARGNDRALAP